MKSWPNPQLRKKLERQVSFLAAQVLEGKQSLVGSEQRLSRLCSQLGMSQDDPVMRTLGLVKSKTHHLPIGQERAHWDPAVLSKKDNELALVEEWAQGFALEACREIVNRYGIPSNEHPKGE